MNKLFSLFTALLLSVVTSMLYAQDAALVRFLREDPTRVGVIMHGYEFAEDALTPIPEGYTPFYISHYGRHGSRSAWGEPLYSYLVEVLQKADSVQNLTAEGKQLLSIAQQVLAAHNKMPGRLTDRGEREHALLAERMYKRYPEVFEGKKEVRSVGSMVQRCLISMAAFTNSLTRCNPNLTYNFDTGEQLQRYIDCAGKIDEKRHWAIIDSLNHLLPTDTTVVCQRLFLQSKDGQGEVETERLIKAIYETAIVAPDFDIECNILDYLPMTEAYHRMMIRTNEFYVRWGNVPRLVELRRPYVQVGLNDFIEKADEVIHKGTYCADLRFGHDVPLLSMMSAMEVSGVGERLLPGEIESGWFGARNLCMASNLQLIFFRPSNKVAGDCKDEEILVKVLYNEKERQIAGLTPVCEGYYRWSDLKNKWSGEVTDEEWKASF